MKPSKDTSHSVLEVGRTAEGYVVRVEGRGSMHESPGLKEFVSHALGEAPEADFTVDLSHCDYLDSTFLGCLVGLHAQFNAKGGHRLQIAGSDDKLGELFGPSGLERILPRHEAGDDVVESWVAVPAAELDRAELGRHLLECHRKLAEVGGPQAAVFADVADQIERDLSSKPR